MNEPLRLPCQHICMKAASPARRLARALFKGGSFSSDSTERLVNYTKRSRALTARARLCPRVLSVVRDREKERETESEGGLRCEKLKRKVKQQQQNTRDNCSVWEELLTVRLTSL